MRNQSFIHVILTLIVLVISESDSCDCIKYSLAHNGKDINSLRTSSSQPLDSDPRADPKTPENPVSLSTMTSIYSNSNQLFCQLTDQLSNSFSKIYLKPHKYEPTIAKFTIDGRDSGTSSAEVTPATTPQTSPYNLRKMMDFNNKKTS